MQQQARSLAHWLCSPTRSVQLALKPGKPLKQYRLVCLKPLSVTTNVVGLQTDDADHVGQNSSAHVVNVVGLQTDAVVVTESRFN